MISKLTSQTFAPTYKSVGVKLNALTSYSPVDFEAISLGALPTRAVRSNPLRLSRNTISHYKVDVKGIAPHLRYAIAYAFDDGNLVRVDNSGSGASGLLELF